MRLIKFFFSGEFLFAAFILSNVYKSALPSLVIDLNIILFVVTIIIALKRVIITKKITNKILIPLCLYFLFTMFSMFSFYYSPSDTYGLEKLLIMLSFTSWSFLAPFILIKNKKSLELFLKSFLLIVILIASYVIFNYTLSTGEVVNMRLGVDGANSLGLGRVTALGIIIVFAIYLNQYNKSIYTKAIGLSILLLLTVVLLLTGARMALISVVLVGAVFLLLKLFTVKNQKIYLNKNTLKVAAFFLFLLLILFPFSNQFEFMLNRFSNMFNETGHGSYMQRLELYTLAFEVWSNNLIFGNGIGSFAINFNGIDSRYYPHNILLEILSELGIIGISIFIFLILIPFFKINILKLNYLQLSIVLMFIYTFINANTTGDINDNRMIFTFLSLLYMIDYYNDE